VFPERLSSHAAITPPAPSEARTSVFWALGARVIGLPFQDQPAAQGRAGAKSSRRLERRNTPTREARTATPMISTTAGHHNGRAQATHNLLYTGILVESNPEGNGLEFSVSVGPPCRPAAANGFSHSCAHPAVASRLTAHVEPYSRRVRGGATLTL